MGSAATGRGFSADLARELGSGSAAAAGAAPSSQDGKADGATARASEGGKPAGTSENSDANAAQVTDTTRPSEPAPPSSTVKSKPRGPVRVPAELAAIKLSLLPNWDRDIDEPGTFQYVVRIKGTQSTKTFTFRYGYDDPRAPSDRDQYKQFLQQSKLMVGAIKDRQRGAAWFLEGTDSSGPAFRYVVLYGGKRLVCYGSMYKDADSNRLGDDRDQTVIQAKQICETIAL